MTIRQCAWAINSQFEAQYHDAEWGVPVHDERLLFELLCLEGAQAGLSWLTILKKRAAYQLAFDNFEPAIIAEYDDAKLATLLQDSGLVRHRLKINSVVSNAKAFIAIQAEWGSFDQFIWSFVDHKPIQNTWHQASDIPVTTDVSLKISKELKKRGFKYVGSVICYAYMQAIGMTNDHTINCFRHAQLK